MSRNLLESLSVKDSHNLSAGVALSSNLVSSTKENSCSFKNMLFSLVADPTGNATAQVAVARRRALDEQSGTHNESRLFEALQLECPHPIHDEHEEEKSATSPNCCLSEEIGPIYSSYVREGPLDLNLQRTGVCFLSGE